jgi:hypothetical protein
MDFWYFYSYTAPYQGFGDPDKVLLPVGYDKDTNACSVNSSVGVIDGYNPATCKAACVWGGTPVKQTVFFGYHWGRSPYGNPAYQTYDCPDGNATCMNCPGNTIGTASCPYVKQVTIYTCPLNTPTYGLKLRSQATAQTLSFNVIAQYVRVRGKEFNASDSAASLFGVSQIVVNGENGTNLALGKPVSTSVTSWFGSSPASIIVDGQARPRAWGEGVWHPATAADTSYIQIDLGSPQMITTVKFYGRAGCCPERNEGIRITLFKTCSRDSDCMAGKKCGTVEAGFCDTTIAP